MEDWFEEYRKENKECCRLRNLISKIEWSNSQQGPGSGLMASGRDGLLSKSCPVCGGIDPKDPYAGSWIAEAIGHKFDCLLDSILKEKK